MFRVTEMAGAIGYAASASALHYDNGDAALCRIKTHCKQIHTSKALRLYFLSISGAFRTVLRPILAMLWEHRHDAWSSRNTRA